MNEHHTRNRTNPPNSEMPNGVAGRQGTAFSARDPYRKLRQLKEQFGPEERWSLIQRHEFGLATQEVYTVGTDHGTSRHGLKFFPNLSAVLDLDERLLRHVARLAKTFQRADMERLSRTTLANGQPLAWSHVRRLLEVPEIRKRDELVREAVRHSWTSEQLARAIQQLKGARRTRAAAGPAPPRI